MSEILWLKNIVDNQVLEEHVSKWAENKYVNNAMYF